MAGRDRNKQARSANVGRRLLVGMGAGAGVFFAAAAMATGSAVTATPAHADFEDLLDPIIQPILTSLTDSLTAFDPAAALDLTSWTDSLLSSLNSLDLALPSVSEPAAAVAAAAEPAAAADITIPITVAEGTEPTVQATVDGADTTLLVDTGSSGLVVPYTDFGSNFFTQLENIIALGTPTSGILTSGYSGGVVYDYLEYNDVSIDYGNGILNTTGPVDVEIYSYDPDNLFSLFTNNAFQDFDTSNGVTGVLGIGENAAGPSTTPLAGYNGVAVDYNSTTGSLIVGDNPGTTVVSTSGAPNSTDYVSIDGGALQQVSVDVDSGGVTGAIPETLLTSSEYNSTTDLVNPGTTIAFYGNSNGTDELYSYAVTAANDPSVTSDSSLDTGTEPFNLGTVYLDYSPSGTGTTDYDY